MENKTVKGTDTVLIKSTVNHRIGIIYPPRSIRRYFTKIGAKQRMKIEELEEALFEPGIEYFFKTGMLYIEDMDQKIYLGLEEEGTKEPTKILEITEAEMIKYLTVKPVHELKALVPKLSIEQAKEMSALAVEHKITDTARLSALSEKTGTELLNIVVNKINEERIDNQTS